MNISALMHIIKIFFDFELLFQCVKFICIWEFFYLIILKSKHHNINLNENQNSRV
jgi:hypothetical protein